MFTEMKKNQKKKPKIYALYQSGLITMCIHLTVRQVIALWRCDSKTSKKNLWGEKCWTMITLGLAHCWACEGSMIVWSQGTVSSSNTCFAGLNSLLDAWGTPKMANEDGFRNFFVTAAHKSWIVRPPPHNINGLQCPILS